MGMWAPTDYVIRYLDHDGNFRFYTGTDNDGAPLFSADVEEARLFTTTTGQRIMALCINHEYDVELIPPTIAG